MDKYYSAGCYDMLFCPACHHGCDLVGYYIDLESKYPDAEVTCQCGHVWLIKYE